MVSIDLNVMKEFVSRLKAVEKGLRDMVPKTATSKNNFTATTAPTSSYNLSTGHSRGSMWIHGSGTAGTAYICTYATESTAVWQTIT